MNLKFAVLTGCLLVFSIVNIPLVPVAVSIIVYTVIMITSLSCSSLTYSYYSSVPQSMYSVLTIAVKSVIGWHMVFASSSYLSLVFGNFMLEDVEDDTQIQDEKNVTFIITLDSSQPVLEEHFDILSTIYCPMLTFLFPRALVITAAIHFQLFRLIFEIHPLWILSLNYERWTLPLNLSIAVVSSLIMFLTIAVENSLCYERELWYMLHQLGRTKYKENFYFAKRQLVAVLNLLGTVLEIIIQIYRKSKKMNLGMGCCLKKSNRISPVNLPSTNEEISNTCNEYTPKPVNYLGSLSVVLTIGFAWYVADFSSGYLDSIMVDFIR